MHLQLSSAKVAAILSRTQCVKQQHNTTSLNSVHVSRNILYSYTAMSFQNRLIFIMRIHIPAKAVLTLKRTPKHDCLQAYLRFARVRPPFHPRNHSRSGLHIDRLWLEISCNPLWWVGISSPLNPHSNLQSGRYQHRERHNSCLEISTSGRDQTGM